MELDTNYYREICNNFSQRCPMWAEDAVKCVPRHGRMIRVFLKNGDYVDYDDRIGTFRYNTKDEVVNADDITDENSKERFARNLSDIMRIRAIGQATLAERTGISQGMISNYLRRKSTPSLPNAEKIARVLKCGIEELTE